MQKLKAVGIGGAIVFLLAIAPNSIKALPIYESEGWGNLFRTRVDFANPRFDSVDVTQSDERLFAVQSDVRHLGFSTEAIHSVDGIALFDWNALWESPAGTVVVPEATTMALLGTGLIGLVTMIRKRRNAASIKK